VGRNRYDGKRVSVLTAMRIRLASEVSSSVTALDPCNSAPRELRSVQPLDCGVRPWIAQRKRTAQFLRMQTSTRTVAVESVGGEGAPSKRVVSIRRRRCRRDRHSRPWNATLSSRSLPALSN